MCTHWYLRGIPFFLLFAQFVPINQTAKSEQNWSWAFASAARAAGRLSHPNHREAADKAASRCCKIALTQVSCIKVLFVRNRIRFKCNEWCSRRFPTVDTHSISNISIILNRTKRTLSHSAHMMHMNWEEKRDSFKWLMTNVLDCVIAACV